MTTIGPLQALARIDLDALLADIGARYEPGTLDLASALDPEWRAALDRAEREVGSLYQTLCEADAALADWRRAVAELGRVWRRLEAGIPAPAEAAPPALEQVA